MSKESNKASNGASKNGLHIVSTSNRKPIITVATITDTVFQETLTGKDGKDYNKYRFYYTVDGQECVGWILDSQLIGTDGKNVDHVQLRGQEVRIKSIEAMKDGELLKNKDGVQLWNHQEICLKNSFSLAEKLDMLAGKGISINV